MLEGRCRTSYWHRGFRGPLAASGRLLGEADSCPRLPLRTLGNLTTSRQNRGTVFHRVLSYSTRSLHLRTQLGGVILALSHTRDIWRHIASSAPVGVLIITHGVAVLQSLVCRRMRRCGTATAAARVSLCCQATSMPALCWPRWHNRLQPSRRTARATARRLRMFVPHRVIRRTIAPVASPALWLPIHLDGQTAGTLLRS